MQNLRVLLVDDEEDFVSALSERLSLRGHDVLTATSAADALSIVENNTLDAAVLDVMMPGITGLELLARINELHPELPVLILTGHGATRDGIEAMRLGAFDFMIKPVDIDELIKRLREAVTAARRNVSK